MPSNRFHQSARHTATPFYLALLLLMLSLLISLSGMWGFYTLFREAKEEELDQRLFAIGKAAEAGLASNAQFTMRYLLEDETVKESPQGEAAWKHYFEVLWELDPGFRKIAEQLRDLKAAANLSEALLISPQKRLIADATGGIAPGKIPKYVNLDRSAWEPAARGKAESMPFYEINGIPYKRVYVPIMIRLPNENTKRVGAILQLGASLTAREEIGRLKNRAYVLACVITALMGTVAMVFYRLVRLFARIEATAAHRDRLEAMGALAAGIAHEIRNPLGIIRTLAEGVSGDLDEGNPAREMVADIIGEVERLNKLVTQYLLFARPDTAEPGLEAHPAEVIRAVAALLCRGDRHTSSVEVEIAPAVPAVPMNTSALRQVMLNLLLNAREASSPDLPVKVRCQAIRGGAQVEIVVSDQGCGMPPRALRRAFDPFFSTKSQGSGLGLPICRHLIRECGGDIFLSSKVGEGTVVRVALPAVKERLER